MDDRRRIGDIRVVDVLLVVGAVTLIVIFFSVVVPMLVTGP